MNLVTTGAQISGRVLYRNASHDVHRGPTSTSTLDGARAVTTIGRVNVAAASITLMDVFELT